MLFKQKSIQAILTILALFVSVKIVSACSVDANSNFDPIAENNFYSGIYFFSSIFLIVAIIVSWFLRGRKGDWLVHITVISVFLMIPLTFIFAVIAQDCGYLVLKTLRAEFIFFLLLFALQIISWIIQRRKLKTMLP